MESPVHIVRPPDMTEPSLLNGKRTTEVYPDVSVMVPCRNEQAFIEPSIQSILHQDYSGSIEIIVIDGMSDDGTRELIEAVLEDTQRQDGKSSWDHPSLVQPGARSMVVLDNPRKVVPVGLNIGLSHARGKIIFRLDGHSQMAPDYVRVCVRTLQEHPEVACVGGPSVAIGSGIVGRAYALALRSPFGVGGRTFRTCRSEAFVDTLAFGGYRKEIFTQVGQFDSELHRNQDIRFSAALRSAGHRQLLIPVTHTLYHAPKTLAAIIKQNFWNGYWNTRVIHKMIGVLSWRHFVPLAFVVALLVSSVMASVSPWGRLALSLIGGSYGVMLLVAGMAFGVHERRHGRWLLPVIFPLMHLCYGCGSLAGLYQFVVHGRPR